MTKEVYHDNFSSWADVQKEYSMSEPEPDVLFAGYSQECYEGSSAVLYRIGDTYYLNEGSHCSCYGLEDQWNPEEYTLDVLKAVMAKRGYMPYLTEIKAIVEAL